jgi:hypothetical protein
MSVLTYNGVTIPYPLTTQFNQETVRDPSGTNRLYTKYDITVQGVLNLDLIGIIYPPASIAQANNNQYPNVAALMKRIRDLLLEDRKLLTYTVGGQSLLPSSGSNTNITNSGTCDSANGPKPQSCNITEVTANTFFISYRIVAHYWEKLTINTTYPLGDLVLSNRWTESVDIDQMQYTVRTREGTIIVRSDNFKGLIADNARTMMAAVAVPAGFLRTGSRFLQSEDGLTLKYTITDTEQHKMPPSNGTQVSKINIYKAEGDHVETIPRFLPNKIATCWVRFYGSKDTSPTDMLSVAIDVVMAKLLTSFSSGAKIVKANDTGSLARNSLSILNMVVKQNMYKNICYFECSIQGLHKKNSSTSRVDGIPIVDFNSIPYTPGSEDSDNPSPPQVYPYGTAEYLMQAAAYYNNTDGTNLNVVLDPKTGNLNEGLIPGQAGKKKE